MLLITIVAIGILLNAWGLVSLMEKFDMKPWTLLVFLAPWVLCNSIILIKCLERLN